MSTTYTPTYYTSLHESITSICKTILPFSFKKRRIGAIAAAEQRLSKQQSDNLKWQQESFHQMLKLMGLCKEGIIHQDEVSAFRTHLLEAIVVLSIDHQAPVILRDKLIFLQELFYSKCITEDEYHASKRPLLQRLAVQGEKIRESDVIAVGAHKEISNEEWSVIDLKETKRLVNSESFMSNNKLREASTTLKNVEGDSSVSAFVSPDKKVKPKDDDDASNDKSIRRRDRNGNELLCSTENPFWNNCVNKRESESKSILMMESLPEKQSGGIEKGKRKPFSNLFQRNQKEGHNGHDPASEDKEKLKLVKRTWGFDGFKKWKKNVSEDETAPLSLAGKSDDASYNGQVEEGPDSTNIKKTLPQNDEVSGENIKKELSSIKTGLGARSQHVHLSDDQNEETSSGNHPVDNNDPKNFFLKSGCDQSGDAALNVVRKESKDHVREMGDSQATTIKEKQHNSKRWTTFDDEENTHPNLFAPQNGHLYSMKQEKFSSRTSFNNSSIDKGFMYNPFFDV